MRDVNYGLLAKQIHTEEKGETFEEKRMTNELDTAQLFLYAFYFLIFLF